MPLAATRGGTSVELTLVLSGNGCEAPLYGRHDHDREPHDPLHDDGRGKYRHGHDRGCADGRDHDHGHGRVRDHASHFRENAHGRAHACGRDHAGVCVHVFLPSSTPPFQQVIAAFLLVTIYNSFK